MKSLRLSALAAALLLAACSTSAPTEPAQVGSASFDEGPGMAGSGNKSGDGGGSLGSGNNSTQDGGVGTMGSGGGTTSSDTTGTQRGGGMLGSGN